MVLKVFRYGEKVLREKAAPVAAVTDALRALSNREGVGKRERRDKGGNKAGLTG